MLEVGGDLWKSPTHATVFLGLGRGSGSGLGLPHLRACYQNLPFQGHFHACRHCLQTGRCLVPEGCLGYIYKHANSHGKGCLPDISSYPTLLDPPANWHFAGISAGFPLALPALLRF